MFDIFHIFLQCRAHCTAFSLASHRSCVVQEAGREGHTRRCSIVCGAPHIQASSSPYPHFRRLALDLPMLQRSLFSPFQVPQSSSDPAGKSSFEFQLGMLLSANRSSHLICFVTILEEVRMFVESMKLLLDLSLAMGVV